MGDLAKFNAEIIMLGINSIDEIKDINIETVKGYCLFYICTREEGMFSSKRQVCPSNRDGKCQMVEFMKERSVE